MEEPGKGRARIIHNGMDLQIILDTRRYPQSIVITVFLCAVLAVWYFSLGGDWGKAFENVFGNGTGDKTFYTMWLIIWIAGGSMAIYMTIRTWTRQEIITISSNTFKIQKKILGIGGWKEYSSAHIKNLRLNTVPATNRGLFSATSSSSWMSGLDFWGTAPGNLAFDYGMKTVTFAKYIDKPEANYLLNLFQERGIPVSNSDK